MQVQGAFDINGVVTYHGGKVIYHYFVMDKGSKVPKFVVEFSDGDLQEYSAQELANIIV